MNNVTFKKANIFTSKFQTLVNTVNCVGVMGAGIALEFKYRYPNMFDKYVAHCRNKLIEVGKLWIYDVPNTSFKILNFPTKKDWKHPSKYEYLEKGLQRFIDSYREKNITSAAFPLLGAQNGGLNPEKVIDLMYKYLGGCEIPIEIYEYDPYASDDLIAYFSGAIIHNSIKEVEKMTGIKQQSLIKIKNARESNNLNSLIQISKIKGIGEDAIKLSFQFALKCKSKQILLPQEIFEDDKKGVIEESEKVHPPSNFNDDTENMGINIVSEPIFSEKTNAKDETELAHFYKDEKTGVISNNNPIVLSDKKEVHKKRSKNVKLNSLQKVVYTGLDEKILEKIENKNEDVTIQQIRQYCAGLKINFKTFLTKTYSVTDIEKKAD